MLPTPSSQLQAPGILSSLRVGLWPSLAFLVSFLAGAWLVHKGDLPPWSLSVWAAWLLPPPVLSKVESSPEVLSALSLVLTHHMKLDQYLSSLLPVLQQLQAAVVPAQVQPSSPPVAPSASLPVTPVEGTPRPRV